MSNITSLAKSASSEDSILFYFSGHGIETDGETFLLAKDTSANVCGETAIPIKWITEKLASSNARAKIMLLDACHSGAIVGKAESGLMSKSFYDSIFPPSAGFATLASCQTNEFSWEYPEKNQSVFSYFLVEGLKGKADNDNDGKITITDANKYVSEKVRNWAFINNKQQTPTLRCTLSGDLLMVNVPSSETKILPRKLGAVKKDIFAIRLIQANYYRVKSGIYSRLEDVKEEMLPKFQANAAKICAVLLDFFRAEDITYDPENFYYKFPAGKIFLVHSIFKKGAYIDYWTKIEFSYSDKNWQKVDSTIKKLSLSNYLKFDELQFHLREKIDINEIVKRCRERGMEVLAFNPVKVSSLTVMAKGWGCPEAQIKFSNFENASSVAIKTSGSFDPNFYEVISPENILEFVKGCLSIAPK